VSLASVAGKFTVLCILLLGLLLLLDKLLFLLQTLQFELTLTLEMLARLVLLESEEEIVARAHGCEQPVHVDERRVVRDEACSDL
jgi:hypothetical protein